ncbi:unnamed protein product, partial [Ectocarpus sp. 12 AP-2014]
ASRAQREYRGERSEGGDLLCVLEKPAKISLATGQKSIMRHRFGSRVRVRRDRHPPSPTYLPLTICRGFAGIAFLCFGELFWMHLNRIGLEGEGKLLGSIALVLGSMMAIGALCGAAGTMFSADEGGRLPLLGAVYLSAPLSLADLIAGITFIVKRSEVLRLDLEHEQSRGGRPHPGPPSPVPGGDDPESQADSFRRLYDAFLCMALAFSVLEALMFRLGSRRIAANAERHRRAQGFGGSLVYGSGLESLLDEEDVRRNGWEDWRGETVQQ